MKVAMVKAKLGVNVPKLLRSVLGDVSWWDRSQDRRDDTPLIDVQRQASPSNFPQKAHSHVSQLPGSRSRQHRQHAACAWYQGARWRRNAVTDKEFIQFPIS